MAAATLRVNWIADQAGPYRVCYRIVGDPDYICTQDGLHPVCAGGGNQCDYDIPIQVDNETCDTITYEGYVQPACKTEADPTGRIPFNVAFIPAPACKRYTATCENSPVDSITITDEGTGYNPLSPPNVTITGGNGAGATATADVGDGGITAIAITVPGSGYSDGAYVGVALIGGTGTLGTADITIAGGVVTVTNVNAVGSAYVDGDVVAPDTGVVGVPGVPAQLTLTSNLGKVTAINLTAPGTGYTSAPTITVDPPAAGINALATSRLIGCTPLTIYDCSGASAETLPLGTLQPSETYLMCNSAGTPTVPADYSIAETGNCLCNCSDVQINNVGPSSPLDITYIDCNGNVGTQNIPAGGPSFEGCIVEGSLQYVLTGDAIIDIVINGQCDAV